MAVWLSVRSIFAEVYERDWEEIDAGPRLSKKRRTQLIDERVQAWADRFNAKLASKCATQLRWEKSQAVFFNEQTSWSALLAIQVCAGCLDHNAWKVPAHVDELAGHPASRQPFAARFAQLRLFRWVPADFDGTIETTSITSSAPAEFGSSFVLQRQVSELHRELFGGTREELESYAAPKDADWNSVEVAARYGLSLWASAARISMERGAPCFMG